MATSNPFNRLKDQARNATQTARKLGSTLHQKAQDAKNSAQGGVSPENVIHLALALPGVTIERNDFLIEALAGTSTAAQINYAISHTPPRAGIALTTLDKAADATIADEMRVTVATSAIAALPGGLVAVFGGAAADLVQFYAHLIRLCQGLCYLYGWGDKPIQKIDELTLLLLIAVATGDSEAEESLLKIARANHRKAQVNAFVPEETDIPQMVRDKILTRLSLNVNRVLFGATTGKVIPIAGAVASSAITYSTLKPMAQRLKRFLRSTPGATSSADVILLIEETTDDEEVIEATYEA